MKKHRNGAAAPAEASLGSQKMSLAPWAALPFLTLPPSSGRRGGHGVVGLAGVGEAPWKRCGGVWWEEGLGWAGLGGAEWGFRVDRLQEGAVPTTRAAAGSSYGLGRVWVVTALSTLLSSTQNLLAHANIAMALYLSQLCFANQELCRQRSAQWTQEVILRSSDGKGQMSVKWLLLQQRMWPLSLPMAKSVGPAPWGAFILLHTECSPLLLLQMNIRWERKLSLPFCIQWKVLYYKRASRSFLSPEHCTNSLIKKMCMAENQV